MHPLYHTPISKLFPILGICRSAPEGEELRDETEEPDGAGTGRIHTSKIVESDIDVVEEQVDEENKRSFATDQDESLVQQDSKDGNEAPVPPLELENHDNYMNSNRVDRADIEEDKQ